MTFYYLWKSYLLLKCDLNPRRLMNTIIRRALRTLPMTKIKTRITSNARVGRLVSRFSNLKRMKQMLPTFGHII